MRLLLFPLLVAIGCQPLRAQCNVTVEGSEGDAQLFSAGLEQILSPDGQSVMNGTRVVWARMFMATGSGSPDNFVLQVGVSSYQTTNLIPRAVYIEFPNGTVIVREAHEHRTERLGRDGITMELSNFILMPAEVERLRTMPVSGLVVLDTRTEARVLATPQHGRLLADQPQCIQRRAQ